MSRPRGHPDNSLISSRANDLRWAAVDDRTAATAPARQALRDRFLDRGPREVWRPWALDALRHQECHYVGVMASRGAARLMGRALESFSRLMDGYFRNPETGEVVLYEKPNTKIKAVGTVMGMAGVLRRAHMVTPGGPFDVFAQRAAMAMLLWWSVDELRRGTTKYRKTIGAVTLMGALTRTAQVEASRAMSAMHEEAPRAA